MPTPEQDHAYYQAGLSELQDYLLSEELFWQLSGVDDFTPRLSLGLLLLTRKRLEAHIGRFADLAGLDITLGSMHARWQAAWEGKAAREIQNRLNLWKNILIDLDEQPALAARHYANEVRNRVIVELLLAEVLPSLSIPSGLITMDASLKARWQAGKFIWESEIASSFPEQKFWYLYGKISA